LSSAPADRMLMEAIDRTARLITAILRRNFISGVLSICVKVESFSNLVKAPRVVAEDRGFVLFF
jgi:hypothetical protein